MRHMPVTGAIVALLIPTTPTHGRTERAIGRETVIDYASNGGLRDWQAGPPNMNVVYVRDRTLRWYRVELTGPRVKDRALGTLTYTTDANGTFDRFSSVSAQRFPNQVCGVRSIKTSLPPKGQPGAPKTRG